MAKKINPFRFKQFIVHHDRCAMKVGTDAVLLGAWVNMVNVKTALDIGAGSGIIALMLAQRIQSCGVVDAVEIDLNSFQQSRDNIEQSPWPELIRAHHTAIQEFLPNQKYDLIVSNPPYFINSLLPPLTDRRDARHTSALTHHDLLTAVKRLLNPDGKFGVILPTIEGNLFQEEAVRFGLWCSRRAAFYSRATKPQERWLLEFSFSQSMTTTEILVLYNQRDAWTESYRSLTREFYLP